MPTAEEITPEKRILIYLQGLQDELANLNLDPTIRPSIEGDVSTAAAILWGALEVPQNARVIDPICNRYIYQHQLPMEAEQLHQQIDPAHPDFLANLDTTLPAFLYVMSKVLENTG